MSATILRPVDGRAPDIVNGADMRRSIEAKRTQARWWLESRGETLEDRNYISQARKRNRGVKIYE
jgi:hypothetical protein